MLQLIFMRILGIHDEPPSLPPSLPLTTLPGYIFTNIFQQIIEFNERLWRFSDL